MREGMRNLHVGLLCSHCYLYLNDTKCYSNNSYSRMFHEG